MNEAAVVIYVNAEQARVLSNPDVRRAVELRLAETLVREIDRRRLEGPVV